MLLRFLLTLSFLVSVLLAKETLTVAIDYEYSPVTYKSIEGKPEGLLVDFWRLWAKKSGYEVKFKFYDWDSSVAAVKSGEAIFHSGLTPDEPWMLASDKIYEMKTSFYQLKKNILPSKLKIGSIDTYYMELAKEAFPNATIIKYNDYLPMVQDALHNKIDLFIDDEIAIDVFLLQKGLKSKFIITGKSFSSNISVITNQKNKHYIDIFNKYFKKIDFKDLADIENDYLIKGSGYYNYLLKKQKQVFEKQKKIAHFSLWELLSLKEIMIFIGLIIFIIFVAYETYKKSKLLNIDLHKFNIALIIFELSMIFLLIYEIVLLDRGENTLAKTYENKFKMIVVADKLRHSSDDLTHFIRAYAATGKKEYKKQYFEVLSIREGKIPRPIGYNAIYWDLDKKLRAKRHPYGKLESLQSIIKKLPFSKYELNKLIESETNSKELVNLETRAFLYIESAHKQKALNILFSDTYYKAKNKIMLPIDEMFYALNNRIKNDIAKLNAHIKTQFIFIFALAFIFIIGNILIYILLVRKLNEPIQYLINSIKSYKSTKTDTDHKTFYDDEIGHMNKEFFAMIDTVNVQTEKLAEEKRFTQALIDAQEQIIVTTDGTKLTSANKTFFDFFAVDNIDEFIEVYDVTCICDTFNTSAPDTYLRVFMDDEKWIDYVVNRPFNYDHKVMISMGSIDFIFSVTASILPGSDNIKVAIFTNITEMEKAKQEIENINKKTRESIEYASLIQGALIPNNKIFRNYFQEYFAIWHPKDTIGGDIYLFEEMRDEDECLMMVIDCTGHGVPGAFVTMLVKAIERQIVAQLKHSDEIISPAKILSIFNRSMKNLLKQEHDGSISNAGFDGGILYYNKKEKIIKYAGAETPLFYVKENELTMIKGDRYSVGYKKCSLDYEYKEHLIEVEEGMQFYLTTDGYLDQNGGEKSFPFGKKRFKSVIKEYHTETMADQQEVFLYELMNYQGEEETNDDMTLIGFTI